jgi:DNA modification methylase
MNKIEFGDCREIMKRWKEEGVKVQTVVTSPPYFGLRDYGTANWKGGNINCDHKEYLGGHGEKSKKQITSKGTQKYNYKDICKKCGAIREDSQIGLEQTVGEYVKNIVDVFADVWNILEDNGTVWLNLGDSYYNYRPGKGQALNKQTVSNTNQDLPTTCARRGNKQEGLKEKDLIGIPWRVAFALQDFGWHLRQDIIWHKPNPMPESVRDRCTKAHEYIFLLTKKPQYYFNNDAIKEPCINSAEEQIAKRNKKQHRENASKEEAKYVQHNFSKVEKIYEKRNKRDVWSVTVKPYKGAHFATYPTALIEPCIKAGSRINDIVFDPFMGSGTTAQVAKQLGRQYLGCELNSEYKKLQDERLNRLL